MLGKRLDHDQACIAGELERDTPSYLTLLKSDEMQMLEK